MAASNIRGRVFAADGTPVNGSDFLISTTSINVSDTQITALADGGFAVTWDLATREIRGQVFAADGTPVNGSDFLVSTTTAGNHQVTALADGGFAVTWQSASRTMTFAAGCLRRTAHRSTAAISWFLRRTPATSQPQITALADGGFAVTWVSFDNGGCVRGRVFAADGTPVNGSDFLVSTANTKSHDPRSTVPQITALADGGFAVTWKSWNGSDYDIRARVFAADGTPVNGSDFLVSTANTIESDPVRRSPDHGAGGWRLRGDVAVVERLEL